jgi:ABC-2 type transport system permease protein
MMSLVIARRELRGLFMSPLAWSIFAIVIFIHAIYFNNLLADFLTYQGQGYINSTSNTGITYLIAAQLYGLAAFVMLVVIPMLTMRLISEERRAQTLTLLISAPLSMQDIIIGKYLGLMAFLLLNILAITLMPLSLLVGGSLDFGHLFGAFIGISLLTAAFTSAGLFMSTLTKYPAVAAIGGFALLFLLWIFEMISQALGGSEILEYLSILGHYDAMLRGVFNTSDLIYYVLFISLFLTLSIRRLEAERLPH